MVLGGGGVTGIAWLTGVIAGFIREGGVVPPGCRLIGTSAGSVVGAELAHGVPAETLVARQLHVGVAASEPFRHYSQRQADAKNRALVDKVGGDLTQARKRIGAFALRSETPSLESRRDIIRSRLTCVDWPVRPLLITAVDASTAQRVVLNKGSGLDLVDSIMASCAVPGVWPVVPLAQYRLMDGGLKSMTNADLALASDYVLVLAPLGYSDGNPVSGHLRAEVDSLRKAGAVVQVIVPDEASAEAIGDNVLDPGRRIRSAEAGLAQGQRISETLHDVWRT